MKTKLLKTFVCIIVIILISCEKKSSLNLSSSSIYQLRTAPMLQVSSHDTTGGNNDRINIPKGDTANIFDITGPGMIARIWFTIDSRDPDYLRNILILIFWDNEKTPSVLAPVGDFFGSPFEYRHFQSENIGMTSGGYYCYFPMPFNNRAKIQIINQTDEEVFAFYYHINYYQLSDEFEDNTGYFHALWKRDIRTSETQNYVAVEATGKGQFVGLHYSGQAYDKRLVFLEGDEMIFVDDDKYPSTYGTGMEDYFNSGWYFKTGEFSAPYHGLVLLDESKGRVSAYRHHIRDAISFQKNIRVTLEHGHANEEAVDISTVAFWYQKEPHKVLDYEMNPGKRKQLKRPVANDVIEVEDLEGTASAPVTVEDMWKYGSDWSNGEQLVWKGEGNQKLSLSIKQLRERVYNLEIYPTAGPDYGNFKLTAGNKAITFSGYSKDVIPEEAISLDNISINKDNLELLIEVTGKNQLSSGYKVGIDAFKLTPVRNYIPEWYMIGPFDNPRNSDVERFGLDKVFPPEQEINLDATYSGSNGQKVAWESVNGKPGGYGMRLWDKFKPYEFIITYALTYVYSPEEKETILLFSSDDGAKIFLNDNEIYRYLATNIARPDQFEIPLQLNKGWNKLLLKLENNFGGYAFYARLIDPENVLRINRIPPDN